jgi:hypothetical protein
MERRGVPFRHVLVGSHPLGVSGIYKIWMSLSCHSKSLSSEKSCTKSCRQPWRHHSLVAKILHGRTALKMVKHGN